MKERLQKIMARAGVASRRKAEELMRQGRVTVNGRVVNRPGALADAQTDHIKVDGRLLRPEPLEYWAVHKPPGVLSTVSDPRGRPVITALVRSSCRLYPVGRLDYHSEGLVILTNDGELARLVLTAGRIPKVYEVKVRGRPESERLDRLRGGIRIDRGRLEPCRIESIREAHNSWYRVTLSEGRNRQIRKMFQRIGHPVMRLRRTAIGRVRLGALKPGTSRSLTPSEVNFLKRS